jgi:DNA-binding MarR family transcriptional regulator
MENRDLFLKTSVASHYVDQLVQRHLDPVGIPGYLLALVTHVRDHAPVTPSGIAEASGIPLTTLRDNIQRLVDRGLARRIPNPDDARSYLLELTPAGLAMTKAADPALLDAYLAVEARLPRALDEYQRAVDELIDALEGALVEPAEDRT